MSDGKNRKESLQDYVDLLNKYSGEDGEAVKRMVAPPPMVDLKTKSKRKRKPSKLEKWYKDLPKKKRIAVNAVAIFLAVVILLSIFLGIFINNKFNLLGDNFNDVPDDVIYDDADFEDIEIDIGSAGFKQSLIDWATTGNDRHMYSKNVINVLLIGADSRKGTNSGNTDVMMLLSLNRKTKELKLISFLRDSYLYIEGKNGNSYCTKLNAAFSMGGPETLMQTIENNYKIDIDNYVMVNFQSFTSIIDEIGGVQVDVQKYEADYNYKKFKVELPVGEGVTLNGKQALCFCRIRGCDADGDVSRTRRQRQVIDAIVDKVKDASISELNKYIDTLLPYVDTGYSKSQILSLGIKAITGGWVGYERSQLQMPPEDCRTSGSANMWIWVVDYELAAHKLQKEIYGKSNITIDSDRTSIIDVYRGANYTGGNIVIGDNDSATEDVVDNVTEGTTLPATTEPVVSETNSESTTSEATEEDTAENTESRETIPIESDTTQGEVPDDGGEENTEVQTQPVTQPATTEIVGGEVDAQ